jgi:hypothetical protein
MPRLNKSSKVSKVSTNTTEAKVRHVHNQLTSRAGLSFNVNVTQDLLRTYYQRNSMTLESQKDGNTVNRLPTFRGGHVVITGVLQEFLRYSLEQLRSLTKKSKDGLRTVNEAQVRNLFLVDNNLRSLYDLYHLKYVQDSDYLNSSFASEKDFNRYVEKQLGTTWNLTPGTINYLCYYLTRLFSDIARTSYRYLLSSGKKQVDQNVVRFASWTLFKNSEQLTSLVDKEAVRVSEACGLLTHRSSEDDEEQQVEQNTQGGDVSEEEETEVEESEEELSDDDNESSDEEEEVVVKKTATKTATKPATKKGRKPRQTKSRRR